MKPEGLSMRMPITADWNKAASKKGLRDGQWVKMRRWILDEGWKEVEAIYYKKNFWLLANEEYFEEWKLHEDEVIK